MTFADKIREIFRGSRQDAVAEEPIAGNEKMAYEHAHEMFGRGEIATESHEAYGELILRYARACSGDISSRTVKVLLLEYLSLVNPRPSELHSRVLHLAVDLSHRYPDFDFVRFLDMWGPQQFMPQDFVGTGSLAARALELVVESPHVHELPQLLDLLPCEKGERMSLMREVFDRLVERRIKDGDINGAIDLLEVYAAHGSLHAPDIHHSHMLSLAMKVMRDGQRSRFVSFFAHWDLALMRPEDFQPSTSREGQELRPLVSRAISYCFEILRGEPDRYFASMPSLLENMDAVPRDKVSAQVISSITGYRAMLLTWTSRADEAHDYMARQAVAGRQDASFWTQYAAMAEDPAMRLSRLALGALRCGHDIADGSRADLMLSLAHSLHIAGYDDAAASVLSQYDVDCKAGMAAEPPSRYGAVKMVINASGVGSYDNEMLYNRLAADALDDIYYNLQSQTMCVTGRDGNLITVSSSTYKPALIDAIIWPALNAVEIGDCVIVKIQGNDVVMARGCEEEKSFSTLTPCTGIAIDESHIKLGDYSSPLATDTPVVTGMCYRGYVVKDFKGDRRVIRLENADVTEHFNKFERATAVVYGLNDKEIALVTEDWDICIERKMLPDATVGDILKLYYFIDSQREPHVLSVQRLAPDFYVGDLITEISGKLELTDNGGGGKVRDAIVTPQLVSQSGLENGMYARCRALRHPDGTLHALTLTGYN